MSANTNSFLRRTHEVPRPTERSHGLGGRLPELQEAWDRAEEKRVVDEAYHARKRAERQARRDAPRVAGEHMREEAFVGGLRARYLAADPAATEADFLRDLPELRRRHRLDAALAEETADARARRENAGRY